MTDGARTGPLSMPACIVVEAKDGRIVRLEEYFDSARVADLGRKTPPRLKARTNPLETGWKTYYTLHTMI